MAVQEVDNSSYNVDTLHGLYESEDLSDLEIIVGHKRYRTHRLVLCMGSDVLKTMLMSKFWPEGRSDKVVLREDPECVEVFGEFLQYLYTGKVKLDSTVVLPLLILADKYNVSHLSESCVIYMISNCCIDTLHHVISWLHYSLICANKQLETVCNCFIANNFDLVIEIPEFLTLSKETLIRFLTTSDIVVKSEYVLFEAMKRWLLHAVNEGEDMDTLFNLLIPRIRFPMLSLQELYTLEHEALMYRNRHFFLRQMYACMRYHTMSPIKFPSKFLQAIVRQKQYVPRIYTTEVWSTEIVVENVSQLEDGHVRGAFFSTPISHSDKHEFIHHDWNVMFYPKGVKYEPCIMIRSPHNLVNNGALYKSVRLAFCMNCETESRFVISVLVYGRSRDRLYIRRAISKDAIFDKDSTRFNINSIIPFSEVKELESSYKTGNDSIHLKIVIRPILPAYSIRLEKHIESLRSEAS